MAYIYPKKYDVIVVGGGNAGIEAAAAAARIGVDTLLITHNFQTIGQQSCNPSIGGIGKSHLVREVDALDGMMAKVTDLAGIQFRVLNASKGAAVRATRAQIDRTIYRNEMRKMVEKQKNLSLLECAVDQIILEGNKVVGIRTQNDMTIFAKTVVLTNGTFLNGLIHVGLTHYSAGRVGDPSSIALGNNLKEIGLPQGRLKTGTPARLDGRTIDFSKCIRQEGDNNPTPVFSFLGDASMHPGQRPCFITNTTEVTHQIIWNNLDRSPLYSGIIQGVGPRYCPSIEDKIHRFADKKSHQVFLEPEGLDTYEYYPNGISTSLPYDVQVDFIHSIPSLEKVHILRPGYAIEYDYFDPTHLQRTFESKHIENLFLAGQINGTTGYEEAAAQGLYAGINAALKVKDKDPFILDRYQAYLGVLVDDLITNGVNEPYRMFTSRAEFRLFLREDNADERLTPMGRDIGLVGEERWKAFNEKKEAIEREKNRLTSTWVNPLIVSKESQETVLNSSLQREYTLADILKRPGLTYEKLKELTKPDGTKILPEPYLSSTQAELLEISLKYSGYIERQLDEIKRNSQMDGTEIPDDFEYDLVKGLSFENRQKLVAIRPKTIGQAKRISGVAPASISLLVVYLKRRSAK